MPSLWGSCVDPRRFVQAAAGLRFSIGSTAEGDGRLPRPDYAFLATASDIETHLRCATLEVEFS